MKNRLFLMGILILALSIFGCRRRGISLDDREPLSLAPDVKWALVTEPYTAFKSEPNWESKTLSHCRKGDIIQILGKVENDEGVWYKFSSGFLPQEVLSIYQNRYKALKQLETLK